MSHRILPLAVALVAFTTMPLPAQVVRDVPLQYPTIQAAIDASNGNDVVRVAPGVYAENLDFKGKAIVVRSARGPRATVVDGRRLDWVVTFRSNEGRGSVLEGFTIRNGAGGILCSLASPTIVGNRIVRNRQTLSDGVGIRAIGAPWIERNVIAENDTFDNLSRGAGLYCLGNAVLTGNVFHRNRVGAGDGSAIYCAGGAIVATNCTIAGHPSGAGATAVRIVGNQSSVRFTNTLFWDNAAGTLVRASGWQASASFDRCLVPGGRARVASDNLAFIQWGAGNLDTDPLVVDVTAGDYHLTAPSPCINAGDPNAPMLAPLDLDGNPRSAYGSVDIGADEVFPHLYLADDPQRGKTLPIRMIGFPGAAVTWAAASGELTPPLPIPGLLGVLVLDPATIRPVSLGVAPASGVVRLALPVPAQFPVSVTPTQALIGKRLSNGVSVALH